LTQPPANPPQTENADDPDDPGEKWSGEL
jgi:hypothetical protein